MFGVGGSEASHFVRAFRSGQCVGSDFESFGHCVGRLTCDKFGNLLIEHSTREGCNRECLLLLVGALGEGIFDQILYSTHEGNKIFILLLFGITPVSHEGLFEIWSLVHFNEFGSKQRVRVLSERIDLFEMLTVHIIDNPTNPTVWGDLCKLEVGLHSVDPCDDVDGSVPLELLNLTLGAEAC